MLTHDATKKWYFASIKYSLLEVGVQLMLAHKYKSLPEVESVHFQICLSVQIPAMGEHIIELAARECMYKSQQIHHTSDECSRGVI